MFDWAAANKLTINISKTCYTVFTKVNCKVPPPLNSVKLVPKQDDNQNSIVIKREKQSKYLGVYLDELLSWNYHLNDTEEQKLTTHSKSLSTASQREQNLYYSTHTLLQRFAME